MGGGGLVVKPKQYARRSNEVKYNKNSSTQCIACDIINISKYVNKIFITNPTTLILSSLVSEFDKKSTSDFFFFFFFLGGGGGGSGGDGW